MADEQERDIARPEGMTTTPADWSDVEDFAANVVTELGTMEALGLMSAAQRRFEVGYLANLRPYRFYGAEPFLVRNGDGRPMTLHVANFGTSPRKNAWGRYVNHYLAFTRPAHRREGYGAHGERDLEACAVERGYDRLKTLCQSWLGVHYHAHLRDPMWAINPKGEIVIDSPLHDGPWPEGVPIKARQHNTTGAEIADEELRSALTDKLGRFAATDQAAEAVIEKRRWRRGQESNLGGSEATRTGRTRLLSATQPPPR